LQWLKPLTARTLTFTQRQNQVRNDFQYDAPRAGLMPEPDGSYIVDQQKAALLDSYFHRKQEEQSMFDDDWDDL
jgi:hypothetical protein